MKFSLFLQNFARSSTRRWFWSACYHGSAQAQGTALIDDKGASGQEKAGELATANPLFTRPERMKLLDTLLPRVVLAKVQRAMLDP